MHKTYLVIIFLW